MDTAGSKRYVAVLLVGLLGGASDGRAQEQEWLPVQDWIHLDPIKWELTTEVNGSWERSVRAGQSSREREIESGIRLKQTGNILDRRIAVFALEVEPVQTKGRFTAADVTDDRDADFLDYSGFLSVLHGTPGPVSFDARTSRSSGTIEGSLGSRSEFTTENRRVAAKWKTVVFPSTLSYEESLQDETSRSGLNTSASERDDVRRIIKFEGRSSKMGLTLERNSFDDLIEDRDRDFTENRGVLTNGFRWGKGSQLKSRIDYRDRTGFSANKRLLIDEVATIQHTRNLASLATYGFTRTEQTVTTTTNTADLTVTHNLYNNLTTSVHGGGTLTESDNSESTNYEGDLDFGYGKRIPWGGVFSAGIGAGYGITDRTSTEDLLDVIDESHVVPVSLVVRLNRRFIDTSTIVVTDAVGVVVFTEGPDYTVVSTVGDLTELRIDSGGLINPTDTILVSYKFQPLPTQKFSTREFRYNAELDFDWIAIFHRNEREDESLISGAGEDFLTDRRDAITGLRLKWENVQARALATVEQRFTRTDDLSTDTLGFTQSLSYRFGDFASVNISAQEAFSESEGRDTDFYNAEMTAQLRPFHRLTVSPYLRAWARKERGTLVADGRRSEQFKAAGTDITFFWRRIEFRLEYDHEIRQGLSNDRTEDRLRMVLIRRSG
jgi:hypothetical protein